MKFMKILKFEWILYAGLLVSLLTGCTPDSPPAGQTPSPTTMRFSKIEEGEGSIFYTIEEGDTLLVIAERFDLSVEELLALNGLKEDSVLVPGQYLRLGNTSLLGPAGGVILVTVDPDMDWINYRSGPGSNYPVIGQLSGGETVEAGGQNEDGVWLLVILEEAPNGIAWLYAPLTDFDPELELPVVYPPPTPEP